MKVGQPRRRWARSAAIAATATATLILGACAGGSDNGGGSSTSGTGTTAQTGPIDIAYLNALTGDFAVAGKPEQQGVKLAIKQINDAGGVCDRQLRLAASEDDQGQANLSVAGLRKLVQEDNQKLIIGPGITPPGLATAPVAEKLGVFFMLETAQREPWEGTKYVFSNISPQDTYSPLIADYLGQQMGDGAKKVAILYANVPYGQAGDELLQKEAADRGWDVVVNEAFDPSQFKFTAQVQKVANANPDGVMIWGAATPADAQVLKQLVGAGYDGPITGDVAMTLPFIPKIAGKASERIVAPSQISYANPDEQTQQFLDTYQQTYNEPATFLPGAAFDAVHLIAEAIKKADCKTDPDSVVAAMDGLTYQGVSGTFNYSSDYKGGPQADSFKPITYRNGQYATPDNVTSPSS